MNASARGDDGTMLLLLPTKKEMYPLNTAALTRAQASRRELANGYRDAFILGREGSLRRIERVDVIGPWGDSIGRKLLSRLTDAWSINVHLSDPLPYPIAEIKHLLIECVMSPQAMDTMQLDSVEARQQFVVSVRTATSVDELLGRLRFPEPEDALDVL